MLREKSWITVLAMNLKARAIEVGIRQTDIAAECGVSDSTVSAWLAGHRDIPSRYLVRLAGLLKLPVEELLPQPTEGNTSCQSA